MLSVREFTDATEYNRLAAGMPITSALQSWGWGEVKRLAGWSPFRLGVFSGGEVVACAQFIRKGAGRFSIWYAPRGPVLRRLSDLPEVLSALAAWLGRGLYLVVEPELGQPTDQEPQVFLGLRPAETIQPEYSLWVRLDEGADAVLAGMKPKTRYNIRLARKKDVTVRTSADAEIFTVFWPLFEETNQRAQLLQHTQAYYQAVLERMNQPQGQAFISLAEWEGKPLAAGLFVAFGGKVDYLYGGSSRSHKQVMAPYAMHWGAIEWAIEHEAWIYDLWGIPRVLSGESHAHGIYRFKAGFGGERVRFPAYHQPLSPLYAPVVRMLRLRKNWVNLRTRGTRDDIL